MAASTQEEKAPEETIPFLTIQGTPIYFQEDWDVGIGSGLWSTGLALARYLQHHPDHALRSLDALGGDKKLSLLELGSGNGFLAICFLALARDRLKQLVVTDVESHLNFIQTTLNANSHLLGSDTLVTLMEHKWGEFVDPIDSSDKTIKDGVKDGSFKFDVIIGSDVAYRDFLYDPLIASLDRFCHEHTVALIGVTMNDTKPLFFHKLRKAGFRYERLADWLMEPEFRGNTFGIFVIQRNKR